MKKEADKNVGNDEPQGEGQRRQVANFERRTLNFELRTLWPGWQAGTAVWSGLRPNTAPAEMLEATDSSKSYGASESFTCGRDLSVLQS